MQHRQGFQLFWNLLDRRNIPYPGILLPGQSQALLLSRCYRFIGLVGLAVS